MRSEKLYGQSPRLQSPNSLLNLVTKLEPTELVVFSKLTDKSKEVIFSIEIINVPILNQIDRITVYERAADLYNWEPVKEVEHITTFVLPTIKNKRKSYPVSYLVEIHDAHQYKSTLLRIKISSAKIININKARVLVHHE